MKNIFMFVLSICMMAVMGCSKTQVCNTGTSGAGLISAAIISNLNCGAPDVVTADVLAAVSAKLCAPAPAAAPATGAIQAQSVVGDAVCGPVITGLVGGLLTKIPATWKCTGGTVTDDLKAKLTAACSSAL